MSTRIGKLGRAALVRWVVLVGGRPGLALALVAALGAGAVHATATGLSINTSVSDMLSPELPFRRNSLAVDAAFPQRDDSLTVVVEAANSEAADTAAEQLATALRTRPELFRAVFYPPGDPFFRRNGLLYLELEALQDLADDLASMQPLLASLKGDPSLRGLAGILKPALDRAPVGDAAALARALDAVASVAEAGPEAAPLSWRDLAAEAGPEARRRFIAAQPVLEFGGFAPAGPALEAIEALAAALPGAPGDAVRVRVTGEPAMRQDELMGLADGMGLVSLVSLALVVVLLAAGLGSLRLIVPAVAALLVGLALTAGFAALAIGELNLISVAFAVLFIGLSVDFGIHFALRYREEALSGRDHGAALAATAEGVGGALSLSALAAAIGFFSFLPTSYRGLSELGLISGAGMFVALFCNLTVLPALLSIMPLAGATRGLRGGGPDVSRIGAHFAGRIGRHPRVVVGIAIALAVAAAPALIFARFDDDPLNLRDPRSPSVAVLLELLDDPRLEPYAADVLAADLDEAAALAARLEALPEVAETVMLADLVPPDQEAKIAVIDDMSLFLAPLLLPAPPAAPPGEGERALAAREVRAAAAVRAERTDAPRLAAAAARLAAALAPLEGDAAGLARFEALVFARLPELFAGLEESLLAAPFTEAELPDDLRDRWLAADGRALVEIRPAEDLRGQAARRAFVAAVQSVAPAASGAPVVITEAGRAVIAAFREAAAIAIAAIAALLLLLLRRVAVVALVLAPLVLAALLTVAAGLVFGLPFNFANVIVLPLLFGLGVAGGLHIVLRARQSAPGGVLATSTPRAVLFSALTTVGSFGALALSRHSGTASMGLLLTLAIGLSMASTLIVLPALLHTLEARREARREAQRPARRPGAG